MQLCLLEEPLKTQKSKKENRSYVLKCNLYLYFLIKQKLLIFREKMLMSAELEGCFTWFIYFWIILRWGITVPSFISLGYVWQILEKGTFLTPPPFPLLNPWAVQKRPILNSVERVNEHISWKNWPKSSIHEFSRISWITNLSHIKTLRNLKSTCEVIMLSKVLDWWPSTLLKMTLLRRQFFFVFCNEAGVTKLRNTSHTWR